MKYISSSLYLARGGQQWSDDFVVAAIDKGPVEALVDDDDAA